MSQNVNSSCQLLTPGFFSISAREEVSYKLPNLWEISFPSGPFGPNAMILSSFPNEVTATLLLAVVSLLTVSEPESWNG